MCQHYWKKRGHKSDVLFAWHPKLVLGMPVRSAISRSPAQPQMNLHTEGFTELSIVEQIITVSLLGLFVCLFVYLLFGHQLLGLAQVVASNLIHPVTVGLV